MAKAIFLTKKGNKRMCKYIKKKLPKVFTKHLKNSIIVVDSDTMW